MRNKTSILVSAFSLALLVATADAQSEVTVLRLEKDQIETVKTAPGITTRLSFPAPPSEIICGDLYDSNSGRGTFVVQRSGNDVYLKPITNKGMSNIFVKTGENGEQVYSFDLVIVPVAQANRVVKVIDAQASSADKNKEAVAARQAPIVLPVFKAVNLVSTGGNLPSLVPINAMLRLENPPPPPLYKKPEPESSAPVGGQPAAKVNRQVGSLGIATKRVKAEYPEFARTMRAAGHVIVQIKVNQDGKVISAEALSGPPVLREAAVIAARKWEFVPAKIDGAPVEAIGKIRFNFSNLDR